jgi:hypothetical protein
MAQDMWTPLYMIWGFSGRQETYCVLLGNDTVDWLVGTNILEVHTASHVVAWLVKALCYKLEGRGIESQWGGFFQFT